MPKIIEYLICLFYHLTEAWKPKKGIGSIDQNGMRISTLSHTLTVGDFKIRNDSRKKYCWEFFIESAPKSGNCENLKIGMQQVCKKGGFFSLISNGTAIRQYNNGGAAMTGGYSIKWGKGDRFRMILQDHKISFEINKTSYTACFNLQKEHFSNNGYYRLFASLPSKSSVTISEFQISD